MRTPSLLLPTTLLLAFVVLPNAAADETFNCHDWEVFHGTREEGVAVSPDDGALYVATQGFYVVSDGDPVRNPWLLSAWVYQENNGEPGLQRGDETCDETEGGWRECDCMLP